MKLIDLGSHLNSGLDHSLGGVRNELSLYPDGAQ